MKEATKLPELPRLPKGQGTLIYTHGNKILYRKAIPVDGGYKRLAVTGNNIRECFDTMRRKEDDLRAGMKSAGSESLAMAIDRWLDLYKQPEVKPSSYDRLRITYKAQITKMTIADKPWKLITADELQAAVNALVQGGYAWSTVKKAYDMLNAFYTFQTRRGYLPRSPMDICRMPLRENMLKRDKEIVYIVLPTGENYEPLLLDFSSFSDVSGLDYGDNGWFPPTDIGLADTTWNCGSWMPELHYSDGDPDYAGAAELYFQAMDGQEYQLAYSGVWRMEMECLHLELSAGVGTTVAGNFPVLVNSAGENLLIEQDRDTNARLPFFDNGATSMELTLSYG